MYTSVYRYWFNSKPNAKRLTKVEIREAQLKQVTSPQVLHAKQPYRGNVKSRVYDRGVLSKRHVYVYSVWRSLGSFTISVSISTGRFLNVHRGELCAFLPGE